MSATIDIHDPTKRVLAEAGYEVTITSPDGKVAAVVCHAVRDGSLVTGQQQYSREAAARLVIKALGR